MPLTSAALRAIGDHAGGAVTLSRITPARYRLTVVPADDVRWLPSTAQEIDLRDGRPADVRVRVADLGTADLSIVDLPADGGPELVLRLPPEWEQLPD